MDFDIISLFPEFFASPFSCGILRIAQQKGIIRIGITNPRNFTQDGFVDDYQFGGGAGMVLKPKPVVEAINHIKKENSFLINLSPQGELLNQKLALAWTKKEHIIIICGRYKGIDERINLIFKPQQISIGDYILAGGEIGALVIIEAITRLLPNVLGNKDSAETDSLQRGLLESPLFTRPGDYKKFAVPNVLRSGNHRLIADWRKKESFKKTLQKRPELISAETFTRQDLEILLEVLDGRDSEI